MLARFALGLFTMFLALTAAAASLEDLEKDQMIHAFRTDALYVDDAGKPFGARFIHKDTGFIFDGLRGSISSGVMGYYAERTPEIPQTVGFVVDTLKKAELDPRLGDYVVAQILGDSRAAASYEARAEGIAG